MPNLSDTITGFVQGDDLDIVRTITGIPATQTLDKVRLTIKAPAAETILVSKLVTSSLVAGVGQIEDTGADGEGVVRFQLTGGTTGDTTSLVAGTAYRFDIQCKTSAGKYYTPNVGTITSSAQVTTVDDA